MNPLFEAEVSSLMGFNESKYIPGKSILIFDSDFNQIWSGNLDLMSEGTQNKLKTLSLVSRSITGCGLLYVNHREVCLPFFLIEESYLFTGSVAQRNLVGTKAQLVIEDGQIR